MSVKEVLKSVVGSLVWEEELPQPECGTILPIRGYRQLDAYSCGYVAGLTALHYLRPSSSPTGVRFWNLCSPDEDNGTPEYKLIQALRKSGISVYPRKKLSFKDIARYIEKGCPIIVCVALDDGGSHWCTIYGVNRDSNTVYVSGSWTKRYSWKNFQKAWLVVGDGLVCSKKNK